MSLATTPLAAMYSPGGAPNRTDTILSGVFMGLFVSTGIFFHFRLFHAYGRKFIYSILCFGFCMARTTALAFRIAVVQHPTNKALNIVSGILVAAGVALLYIVLLQMSRRFFGQLFPEHALAVKRVVNTACYSLLPIMIMAITAVVYGFTTSDPGVQSSIRKVRQAASLLLLVLAFLPTFIVLLLLSLKPQELTSPTPIEYEVDQEDQEDQSADAEKQIKAKPRVKGEPISGFGKRPLERKDVIETALCIIIPSLLFTWEQGIRIAQSFYTINFQAPPPWYSSKATFWVSIFGVEWIAVVILGLAVLPKRFSHLQLV